MSQLLENVFADPKGFGIGPDGRYRYENPGFTAGTAEVGCMGHLVGCLGWLGWLAGSVLGLGWLAGSVLGLAALAGWLSDCLGG
jgi:hypothetical protein